MGIELAKSFVRIRADSSGLRGDLNSVRREVDSGLQQISASAAAILGVFSAASVGFLTRGGFLAGQFEQTTIAFETMLGSAEETQKLLADLTTFAARTPFEMPGILQAARGLVQFGERGDELLETLNILGNAASGTSTDFGFLALVFNQVRGVGKLLTQDFRQLSTRGVLSLQDIADHFGVTLEAAQALLSGGKVSFDDFRDILKAASEEGGRFFNLMEKQSRSLLGLLSTLTDAWNIMSRVLGQTMVPAAKVFVGVLISMVDSFQTFIEGTGLLVNMAKGAIVGATAFSTLAASILAARVAMIAFGITSKAVLIGTGIGIAVVAIGAVVGALAGLFSSAGDELEKLDDKIKEIEKDSKKVEENLTQGFGESGEFIKGVGEAIELIDTFAKRLQTLGEVKGTGLEIVDIVIGRETDKFLDEFIAKMKEIEGLKPANPVMALRKELDKLEALGATGGKGIRDVVKNVIEKEIGRLTGITEAISKARKELGLVQGLTTEIDLIIEGFAKGGALPEQLHILRETLERTEKTQKSKEAEKIKESEAEQEKERIAGIAESIFEKTRTPLERMKKELEQLEMLRTKELIDPETFRRAVLDFGSEIKKEAPKALLSGGRFGFAQMGAALQDALLNQAKEDLEKERNKLLNKNLLKQDEIIKAIKAGNEKVLGLT